MELKIVKNRKMIPLINRSILVRNIILVQTSCEDGQCTDPWKVMRIIYLTIDKRNKKNKSK